MNPLALVIVFGGLGAAARYLLDGWISHAVGGQFPVGTLVINVLGSFALGVVIELSIRASSEYGSWRVAIGIGFLGAFTTFSTFAYETMQLIETGSYLNAVTNVLLTISLGLIAVAVGLLTVRIL